MKYFSTLLITIACILSGCSRNADKDNPTAASATASASASDPQTSGQALPPHSAVEGIPLGEWTGAWWQWADAAPEAVNDVAGTQCGLRQSGLVWFLAGSFSSGKMHRHCTVPQGKYIFFPIINSVMSSDEDKPTSCNDLMDQAKQMSNEPKNLHVTVDGKNVDNPVAYREASSKCFNLPANVKQDEEATPTASNGYWIMLRPFARGTHTISFGGQLDDFSQDITYELAVE